MPRHIWKCQDTFRIVHKHSKASKTVLELKAPLHKVIILSFEQEVGKCVRDVG